MAWAAPSSRIACLPALLLLAAAGSAAAAEGPPPAAPVLAPLSTAAPSPAPVAPSIWTPAVRRKMVADALKITPPALARIIERHRASLIEGLARGESYEGQPHHRQNGDTPGLGAAAALTTVAAQAVDAVDSHRAMKYLVFSLGLVAHFAADLSDPTLTTAEGAAAAFTKDYAAYAERNLTRFPVVFYGYPVIEARTARARESLSVETLEAEGHAAAEQARRYFSHLSRAYERSGGSSRTFDVRSIPFGVASLCYSRGVTNIARAWLHIWRTAGGDLTGTPLLRWEEPAAEQASRSDAARAPAASRESKDASKD